MIDINKLFEQLMKKFLPKFIDSIKQDWEKSSKLVLKYSNKGGENPLNMTKKQQKANTEIINELVKGVNQELSKKINYLVNKSVTENWSNEILTEELKGIFEKDNVNYFNYKDRMKVIAETESARIMNSSAYNTAKDLGYTHKYLFNTIDKRTGEDSLISHAKYDNPEDAIPIDEPFTYTYKGKERIFMLPPDRPRDRSFTLYINK